MNTSSSGEENLGLKDQNELKKLKLTLETGATFFAPEDIDIPAKIEADWLANIEAFEKQYATAKMTTVYKLLGEPDYKPVGELNINNIGTELARLLEIMEQQSCFVEILSPLTDEQQYRFITEELFAHETTDMRMPGMMLMYSYEEFHPNNEYDLRRFAAEFFSQIFKKPDSISPAWLNLAQQVTIGKQTYDHQEFKAFISKLFQSIDSAETISFEITNLFMEEDSAEAHFDISYEMCTNNTSNQFKGKGQLFFITECGYWSINKINLPVLGF